MPEFGPVLVSTISLNELLLDEDGDYTSDEAIAVDEQIFFFVENNEINLEEEKLINLVNSQVK